MHRTEGTNNVNNLFTSGPPGTNVGEFWLNAVQEEICYAIEQAGLTLKTAGTDTRNQLKSAIEILSLSIVGFAAGTKMYFYQDVAPSAWTIDAVPADALLAVKGGANAYNVAGGNQAGTWTQPDHNHGIGTYAVGSHTHGAGTYTVGNHTHGVGSYVMPAHLHDDGTLTTNNHTHNLDNSAVQHTDCDLGSNTDVIKETVAGHLETYYAGGGGSRWVASYTTVSSGSGAVTGSTDSTGPTAITGTSGSGGAGAVGGSSASAAPGFSGNSANAATANTWRPLAQVGIICTKS